MLSQEEKTIRSEIHGLNSLKHIRAICKFGDRFVGMEGDKQSIQYIESEFDKLGIEIEHTPIRIPTYEDNGSSLILTDTTTELECISPYFTQPTSKEGVKGELVFIGKGAKEDYEGVDVKGKIVVLHETGLGYSLFWLGTFSEFAAQSGAVGMVVIHPFPWPYRMSMEAGNSNLDNRFPKTQVPAVCISSLDGLTLMHQLGEGKANAHLSVRSRIYDVDSVVLSGVIKGTDIPEERVAVLGHRDHGYPPGANDNLSGIGNVLELARVFSKRKPRRSLEFICSTGEEGTTPGISKFIQANKDRLSKLKAVIDMDMFGGGGQLHLVEKGLWPDTEPIIHTIWLLEMLEEIADDMGYYASRMTAEWGDAEVARFIEAGVPAAWFWKPDDMYYHSKHDTPDKVDANSLKAVADITGVAMWRISSL